MSGGFCYSGEMALPEKTCACAVHHHGGFQHGPPTEGGNRYCFDCFVIKECHLAAYQGPPCKHTEDGISCGQLQGHNGPHSFQGSLL